MKSLAKYYETELQLLMAAK